MEKADTPQEVSAPPETAKKKALTPKAKLARAALICGIVALAYPACITGPIGSVAAIIMGILGIRSERRGSAIAGIVLGCVALAMLVSLTQQEIHLRRLMMEYLQRKGQ